MAATRVSRAEPAPSPKLVPHAPLTDYYADEPGRQRFIADIFDATAADYDRIEHVLAFGSGPWYRGQALKRAGLAAGAEVVDVGIGTGLVARQALKIVGPTGRLVGVDPSPGMMGQAKLPAGVELKAGRAEALPVADASCDFVSMGYALRHLSDLSAAFSEFHRVLRPGGRVLVLEITRPESAWALRALKLYMRAVVPAIAAVVSRQRGTSRLWRYYWDTIEACVAPETVMEALRRAGFKDVQRHVELGIFSEYTAQK